MDISTVPLWPVVLVAGLAGTTAFIVLILGWPWIKRASWARKARKIRGRAVSRLERFTAETSAPGDPNEEPTDARIPRIGDPSRGWRPTAIIAAPGATAGQRAWEESSRLRRLAAHVTAHADMVANLARELDEEAEPLRQLLDRQASAMDRVMAKLGLQLEPVRAFAAGEESNLRALQERMEGEGMRFVAHAFAKVLDEQRERTEATLAQIDGQREPFEQFASDQLKTIELALKRFDGDVAALENALAEQRKVALRLLEAMRSDEFNEVKDLLLARQQALEELAESGITDPSHIAARLRAIRGEHPSDASADSHFGEVIESAMSADERLMAAGTGTPVLALVGPDEEPEADEHDAEGEDEARPAA